MIYLFSQSNSITHFDSLLSFHVFQSVKFADWQSLPQHTDKQKIQGVRNENNLSFLYTEFSGIYFTSDRLLLVFLLIFIYQKCDF